MEVSSGKKNIPHRQTKPSFVETAMKLGGKSDEEARSTGAVDQADDEVESIFAPEYQTVNSPIHRAVWGDKVPVELYTAPAATPDATVGAVMDKSIEIVRRRQQEGTLHDSHNKISEETFAELAEAGYWGLLVEQKYGGLGASFSQFAQFLTRMSTVNATVAGLASVHGCIGAVDPVQAFGNLKQKAHYLPLLASGKRLSAFALTEPNAGSDLTAMRTTARLEGEQYVVNGEKLFITNAVCGRTIGLVCLIDDAPAVLIVDLPDAENEHFQIKRYALYALKETYNNGLIFKDFKVPKENLLEPAVGNGLTIAYHGLNRGRVALCANAAGVLRGMMANILPWAKFRRTYGAAIEKRELVRRRIARIAAYIAGCDALTAWCSHLLDAGYRGEMECIVAKIFGSEAQKDAAIELFMKTHGGRAFLKGHSFGDHIHEVLAPCIYEGEGEMLGMAFFKSLVKQHGLTYFKPVADALAEAGIKEPNPLNPAHAWVLRKAAPPYVGWLLKTNLRRYSNVQLPKMPSKLAAHARFAAIQLGRSRLEIDALMRKYALGLADRQCLIADLSQRIQNLVVMLVTSQWASQQSEIMQMAADVLCQDLQRTVTGGLPNTGYFRTVNKLGEAIAEGEFAPCEGVAPFEIMMPYAA